MKNLIDIIKEANGMQQNSNGGVNIIIGTSGSMNDTQVRKNIENIIAAVGGANLYALDSETGSIASINDLNDINVGGPHIDSLASVEKFYKDNIGYLNIYIQN